MENYFNTLNTINVNEKAETKNGLTYLSWAWAWAEVKKIYPDANYTVYERYNEEFGPINYFTDGRTCWVKTGVTINDIEHIEYLPVMDFRNKSIPEDVVTSFDVNKTIQRSLTKALARHGLGLYIYAGEDLPETDEAGLEKLKLEVEELLMKTDTDREDMCKYFKKDTLSDLSEKQLREAKTILEKKTKKVVMASPEELPFEA